MDEGSSPSTVAPRFARSTTGSGMGIVFNSPAV